MTRYKNVELIITSDMVIPIASIVVLIAAYVLCVLWIDKP